MQVGINPEYIRSRRRLHRRTVLLGMLLLTVSFIMVFVFPRLVYLAWPLLILGFVVSNVGRQIQFEAGVSVPTEERITRALNSLSARYWLGHYVPIGKFFIRHMLVGPEGVLVMEPRNHPRDTSCANGKWKRRTSIFSRFLGIEPGIGNPTRDLEAAVELVRSDLAEAGFDNVPVAGAVVFTTPSSVLNLDDCPVTALNIRQLEAWAASHKLQPKGLIDEPLRHRLTQHYSSRLPAAPPPAKTRGS